LTNYSQIRTFLQAQPTPSSSVCPSVTFVNSVKTKFLHSSFPHQTSWQNWQHSDGNLLLGAL